MVNTLRNFTSTHHISGSELNINIMPGILLTLTLVLINIVLISFILAAFTPLTFTLILLILINVYTCQACIHFFLFKNFCSGRLIKNSFFEGVL